VDRTNGQKDRSWFAWFKEQNSTSPTYKTNKYTMQSYVEAMSQ